MINGEDNLPKSREIRLSDELRRKFIEAVRTHEPVCGLTHNYYKYPARFSPEFARAAIVAFTRPNNLVLDPFMGGATTVVEARGLGRRAIGVDKSLLATFVAKAKTTVLSNSDVQAILEWSCDYRPFLNIHRPSKRPVEWIEKGYQRNLMNRQTWRIRKTVEQLLEQVEKLKEPSQQCFVRCAVLRTAQWALDCRDKYPGVSELRKRFDLNLIDMLQAMAEFSSLADKTNNVYKRWERKVLCLNGSAEELYRNTTVKKWGPPNLILTSPPYPGVHVVYDKWQIKGRRETPAPFWIANVLDGHGPSYYTFGDRKQQKLIKYFDELYKAFFSLARLSSAETVLVQMVAFSNPSWQLPQYLEVLERAGFVECYLHGIPETEDGRLWRKIPHRKWYATNKGEKASSEEVVLFHRLDYTDSAEKSIPSSGTSSVPSDSMRGRSIGAMPLVTDSILS